MRVALPRALGDERGVSGVFVGISIVMLVGFAAFAIDLGKAWQDRRHVIVATDAAALASAQEYALGENGCAGIDDTFVTANDDEAEVVSCTPGQITSSSGFVTVVASTPVDFAFAGVLKIADTEVQSTTTASYEVVQTARNLRPFGLCASIATVMGTLGGRHRVYYDKATQALEGNPLLQCAENPSGNWAIIDLDDDGDIEDPKNDVGNKDTKDWTANGYDGSVSPGPIGGSPGAFSNSLGEALRAIQSGPDEKVFCLPVYAAATEQGANATYDVVGFVAVTLWDSFAKREPADRYLELRIEAPGLCSPGEQGTFPVVDFGARTVRICAVDHADDVSDC